MEYLVRHRTTYRYLQDVSHSWHLAHLRPRATPLQAVHDSSITPEPGAGQPRGARGLFPQSLRMVLHRPAAHPSGSAGAKPCHGAARRRSDPRATACPGKRCEPGWKIRRTRKSTRRGAVSLRFAADRLPRAISPPMAPMSFPPGRPVLAGAMELMNRIHQDFRYDTTVTDVTTPVDRVFEIRAGVCQDLAHVGIAAMRAIGLPARYVSGYLLTQPPPGKPRLLGADASHAWFSVWAPPFGWVDLDPTNDIVGGRKPCHRRLGPRLWRCRAGGRHHPGRPRPCRGCGRGRDPRGKDPSGSSGPAPGRSGPSATPFRSSPSLPG